MASIPFSLSDVPGAVNVSVTLTPEMGEPITLNCTKSPCTGLITNGNYKVVLNYLDTSRFILAYGTSDLHRQ